METEEERSIRMREEQVEAPVKMVGDILLKNMHRFIQLDSRDSQIESMSGAGISTIVDKAKNWLPQGHRGPLIIQGAGISLKRDGVVKTVQLITKAVKTIQEREPSSQILVIGLLPRPAEGQEYDRMRRETNRRLAYDLDYMTNGWQDTTSYVGLLPVENLCSRADFMEDGVHLTNVG